MKREELVSKFEEESAKTDDEWDVLVVGGGATGLGIALDSVSRGLKTILLEKGDFASRGKRLCPCR